MRANLKSKWNKRIKSLGYNSKIKTIIHTSTGYDIELKDNTKLEYKLNMGIVPVK